MMCTQRFIEDIFIDFHKMYENGDIDIEKRDQSVISDFSFKILFDESLTEKQANFIILLLKKYKKVCLDQNFDYTSDLIDPKWVKPFRVMDYSKVIDAEKDQNGNIYVILKCPWAEKEKFEKEFFHKNKTKPQGVWDNEKKIKRYNVYSLNLIEVYEYVSKNDYIINENFQNLIFSIENIWENQDHIIPYSEIKDGGVILKNALDSINEFWEKNRTGQIEKDLFLAKTMGYPAKNIQGFPSFYKNLVTSENNIFWLPNLENFFDLYKKVGGNIVLIVKNSEVSRAWIKKFLEYSKRTTIDQKKIKVCFRLDKNNDDGFNDWIKNNGYGGKIDGADLLIFADKIPKWLLSEEKQIKIIATNSIYPIPSLTTQTLISSHPCVIYLGELMASQLKDKEIVQL